MNTKENPYLPPVDLSPGHFDHSLIKRFLFAVSILAIFYLLVSVVGWWQLYRADPTIARRPLMDTIVQFATGWETGMRPSR